MAVKSLWGDDFVLKEEIQQPKKKKQSKQIIIDDIDSLSNEDIIKLLKSKGLSVNDRLSLINKRVLKVLGKQKDNVIIIRDVQTYSNYIDKAIEVGRIAIDTETNNTLDYINCKLMGLCLYYPGGKQAYIPVNHTDLNTGERLKDQLTEEEIAIGLKRIVEANNNLVNPIKNKGKWNTNKENCYYDECQLKSIFHNYKFDFQVLKATCGVEMPCYWDTAIAVQMIDERLDIEPRSLKKQYIKHIDPTQEKYDIEHLFEGVEYAIVDPDVFALYAATDSMMTDKLFEYQYNILTQPEYEGMYYVFRDIEQPLIKTVALMEYRGISVDQEYAKKLQAKYHKTYDDLMVEVNKAFEQYIPAINKWRLTKEANEKPKKYLTKDKVDYNLSDNEKIAKKYMQDNYGWYKFGKSKTEQLADPINLDSPTQLAILLFDILKFPTGLGKTVDDTERGTGANVLEILAKDYDFKLGDLLAKKGALDTVISTFVDSIPNKVNSKDGKVHTLFNQLGAIARFSSGGKEIGGQKLINLQNIPARENKDIRAIFKVDEGKVLVGADLSAAEVRASVVASEDEAMMKAYKEGKDLYSQVGSAAFHVSYEDCLENYVEGTEVTLEGRTEIAGNEKTYIEEPTNNEFNIPYFRLVQTTEGFIQAAKLTTNNVLVTDEGNISIKQVIQQDKNIIISI